ncbi:MAG: hypothetical protein HYT70_02645 [Candidatus Aenigmarchaeota archaeon]|nr:hypothetical protein [Candidatus Aenigmarchaeota archaeon]
MSRSLLAYMLLPLMLYAGTVGYNSRNTEVSRLNAQLQSKVQEIDTLKRVITLAKPTRAEIYGQLIILGESYGIEPAEVTKRFKQYEKERGLDFVDGCAILPEACFSKSDIRI